MKRSRFRRTYSVQEFLLLLYAGEFRTEYEDAQVIYLDKKNKQPTITGWAWNELVTDKFRISFQRSYSYPQGKQKRAKFHRTVNPVWTWFRVEVKRGPKGTERIRTLCDFSNPRNFEVLDDQKKVPRLLTEEEIRDLVKKHMKIHRIDIGVVRAG